MKFKLSTNVNASLTVITSTGVSFGRLIMLISVIIGPADQELAEYRIGGSALRHRVITKRGQGAPIRRYARDGMTMAATHRDQVSELGRAGLNMHEPPPD